MYEGSKSISIIKVSRLSRRAADDGVVSGVVTVETVVDVVVVSGVVSGVVVSGVVTVVAVVDGVVSGVVTVVAGVDVIGVVDIEHWLAPAEEHLICNILHHKS